MWYLSKDIMGINYAYFAKEKKFFFCILTLICYLNTIYGGNPLHIFNVLYHNVLYCSIFLSFFFKVKVESQTTDQFNIHYIFSIQILSLQHPTRLELVFIFMLIEIHLNNIFLTWDESQSYQIINNACKYWILNLHPD